MKRFMAMNIGLPRGYHPRAAVISLLPLPVLPHLLYDRWLRARQGGSEMNDSTDNIIVDTATRIFQDLCEPATINDTEKGVWPKALWDALEESGLPLAWVPDDLGGAGATMADGFAVLRVPTARSRCGRMAGSPAGRAMCRSPATPTTSLFW